MKKIINIKLVGWLAVQKHMKEELLKQFAVQSSKLIDVLNDDRVIEKNVRLASEVLANLGPSSLK